MSTMIDTPDGIRAYIMLAQRGALKLEIAGLRHSSGRSIAKFIREAYGLKCGSKKTDVLAAFEALLREKGVLS